MLEKNLPDNKKPTSDQTERNKSIGKEPNLVTIGSLLVPSTIALNPALNSNISLKLLDECQLEILPSDGKNE